MAIWDADAETTHPMDFRLVRDGFVTMFWQSSLLDDSLDGLRSRAYQVVEFDARAWSSDAEMCEDVASQFGFPDYSGRDLDALNDCMSDVASGSYGWDAATDTGLVIALRAFDAFAERDRRTAQIMLDIVATRARSAMLIGHRIICLVQSNDPRLAFEPVGAMPVVWNDAEWLDTERGL
ncbi:barstar family protein [Microbacterium sp. ASV81]|uniref:Barstar family protein n=1 Tax=Microbacterium capsulatum TaxID=3041921 RepID=A0ABU0XH20_9MICO|nr:barstar family protein [Microbacterium sp. ASV81]MDQ4213964.1 barstar family protein [Microbacterium sp. ASV81]